eukprot:5334334-Alexandrium_andersonii.AAC.1
MVALLDFGSRKASCVGLRSFLGHIVPRGLQATNTYLQEAVCSKSGNAPWHWCPSVSSSCDPRCECCLPVSLSGLAGTVEACVLQFFR